MDFTNANDYWEPEPGDKCDVPKRDNPSVTCGQPAVNFDGEWDACECEDHRGFWRAYETMTPQQIEEKYI